MRIMKTAAGKVYLIVILGLAVCALMQTTILNAKDPVTRPFSCSGQLTIIDLWGGSPLTYIDQGLGSQIGKYVGVGKYPEGEPGWGIYYAANGDQLFCRDVGGGVVEWIGGTGQFQGVTGLFTISATSDEFVPGPQGTWNWVINYTGEGTITY